MSNKASRDPALDPQVLDRVLVTRENVGDVEGMAALYEPEAVLDCGNGQLAVGAEAIRAFYSGLVATGVKFNLGDQRAAIFSGDWRSLRLAFPMAASLTKSLVGKKTEFGYGIDQPSIAQHVEQ